jgi:hypothetical protein
MLRTLSGFVALSSLLLVGPTLQAGDEPTIPFHTTLTVVEDCQASQMAGNPSDQCLGFWEWVQACQDQGYDWAFQTARKGEVTLMGRVKSFEQGCLDMAEPGTPPIFHSYVQLTITGRHGDTLTLFAAVLFDFGQPNVPAAGGFSIVGGTGRFAGAGGSGTTGSVTVDGNAGAIIYNDGWLRLATRH